MGREIRIGTAFMAHGSLGYWIVTNRKQPGRRGKIQLVDGTGFFKKMRKSLGNKRNEVCEEQCGEITWHYGALEDNQYVLLFDNRDFGYWRLTVERPLKLNFAVTPERLARLEQTPAFARLATSKKRVDSKAAQAEIAQGLELQKAILAALSPLALKGVVKNREVFTGLLKAAFRKAGLAISAPLFKAILAALSERDETADICADARGNPELRDYENVPLKEDVEYYLQREVLPHVPDA